MKAFNTLFILSLSFFLSHKATSAAPIPVLDVSDAREQIHDALDEVKTSGESSNFGVFRRRMDDLEHKVAGLEQKKEPKVAVMEQKKEHKEEHKTEHKEEHKEEHKKEHEKEHIDKKHTGRRDVADDIIGDLSNSTPSAADNLGALGQAFGSQSFRDVLKSDGSRLNLDSLLGGSRGSVIDLSKRADVDANVNQADLDDYINELGTTTNGLSSAIPAVPVSSS